MIKSIHIENFQSHANTELTFSPGVNIIVGTSDSGKTAIIRAMRWVVWNRPSGNDIRSNWGGATSVRLGTEEVEVTRSKDKVDSYILHNLYEGKVASKNEFKAIGTGVPEEIQRVLNIDEINLQSQHDAPFLISESPGAVAAHFNKVAHLDTIDTATSKINGWLRGLKSDIEHTETDIESEKEKLKTFDHLDKFEAELEVLEALAADLSNLQSRQESLRKDIRKYISLEVEIVKLESFITLESLVDNTLDLISQRDLIREQFTSLSKVTKRLKDIEEDEVSINHLLEAEPVINNLLEKYANVKALQSQQGQLKSVIRQIGQCEATIKTTETNLKVSEERFHKEMGDVCILCNQPIKKK